MSTADDLTGQDRYPRNRALRPGRSLGLLGLGLATYALSFLLSRAPGLAESLFGSGLGPPVVRVLTFLTGWIPFSVGELLVLAYLLYLPFQWTDQRAATELMVEFDREGVVSDIYASVDGSVWVPFQGDSSRRRERTTWFGKEQSP